jgi:hypothetical protein
MTRRNGHGLRKYLLALVFLTLSQTSFSQSAARDKNNSAGLQVKLRLTETLSSANAKVGQPVLLEVVQPLQVDGKVIVAAGARAHATVTTARRRGHNHRDGQLLLTVRSVSRVDGGEALLQSATVQEGSGHGAPIFGPCTFPFPADPVGLFRKGANVVIPKGTELVAAIAASGS